jgi:LysR family transcriptional regulator, nitrogen assimilation regulatory protein
MIDVRQLTYFIAVVEARSFTAAAEVLCIAQPALSQHLRRLEEDFGHQLLVRHSRGVEPTQAGLRLVEHARSILTMVETAKKDIRNFDEQAVNTVRVRIGLPRSLCDAIGVDLIGAWPHDHPEVTLQIVEQSSSALTESVLSGRIDLAVTSFPLDSRAVTAEPLLQEKLCAVLPPQHHAPGFGEIRFSELAQEPLILYGAGNVSRQLIDMTAKYCSVQLKVAYEIDSPELSLRLVESGVASTIQPFLAVRRHIDSDRMAVRLIVQPGITRRLHLISSHHRPLTDAEREVSAAIKSHLARQFTKDHPLIELDSAIEA